MISEAKMLSVSLEGAWRQARLLLTEHGPYLEIIDLHPTDGRGPRHMMINGSDLDALRELLSKL